MAKLTINRGSQANDGTGDSLREGANKVNSNFDEIYTAIGNGTTIDGTVKFADDSSTVSTISANGETLRVLGGTAITTTISGNDLTINADTASLLSATGTATITNKTIDLTDNTITGTLAEFNTAVSDATLVDLDDAQTLTNKTISADDNTISGVAASSFVLSNASGNIDGSAAQKAIPTGAVVGSSDTQTLTNKTISGADNTITNLSASNITGAFDNTSSGSKIRFNFAGTSNFPSESTYEGMFAYDTTGNEAYVADSGGWTKLINENASVGALSNVNIVGVTDGQALIWSSAQGRFNPGSIVSQVVQDTTPQLGGDLDAQTNGVQDVAYVAHRSPDATVVKTFTVTVGTKTSEHYRFGQGSTQCYLIDGHESPMLQLSPGTYRFDTSDVSVGGHPLAFYYDDTKLKQFSTNVTTNGTAGSAGAYTEILIEGGTPTPLYYQCTAHPYMGHGISLMDGRQHRINFTDIDKFTGDGSTTVFAIETDRSVEGCFVFVNGICLVPTDDYTISGSNMTFATAPVASAEITIRYIG